MKRLIVFLILLAFVLVSVPVMAATVDLAWTAPTTNEDGTLLMDLAGYNIYYGTASGIYGPPIDAGNLETIIVDVGNIESVIYFFTATAYDTSGNESGYSNEISVPFAANPPAAPTMLRVGQ